MFIKHKQKLVGFIFILVTFYLIKSYCFSKTEFVVLKQMTRIDTLENRINEVVLVKNPPKTAKELEKLIVLYNSERIFKYPNIKQLFIKERNYILFPALGLQENYKYEDFETKTDKLDNADFLGVRNRSFSIERSKVFDTTECFVGEYDYYKE
ncbi:hypothetical protein SAMN05444005_105168 [Flavobacterium urocaniciphilum]|uniref:Uncharacterized protein n=2 Tax=Flavobacterium urocaniciphilum TaxID=1299341 RepID=A0A1H9D0Q2_9FLAO|nr:hypothetical protein SAMN05444005_105168 [Flavobacterium urocaniciphilum]